MVWLILCPLWLRKKELKIIIEGESIQEGRDVVVVTDKNRLVEAATIKVNGVVKGKTSDEGRFWIYLLKKPQEIVILATQGKKSGKLKGTIFKQ